MSSDSEGGRDLSMRAMEHRNPDIRRLKRQMRIAKQEMLKCNSYKDKHLYDQLEIQQRRLIRENSELAQTLSEREVDELSDSSFLSTNSLNSRSFDISLDNSQEIVSPHPRDYSGTPKNHRKRM